MIEFKAVPEAEILQVKENGFNDFMKILELGPNPYKVFQAVNSLVESLYTSGFNSGVMNNNLEKIIKE